MSKILGLEHGTIEVLDPKYHWVREEITLLS